MFSIWNHYQKVVPTCEDLPSIQMWRQLVQESIVYCITSTNIASMSAPPISWLPHCDQHSRQSVTPPRTPEFYRSPHFITTLLPLSHCPSSPRAGFWFRWRAQDGDWGKCFVRVGNVHYCPIICCPARPGSCLIPHLWFLLHCHRYTRRKSNLSPFALNVLKHLCIFHN